LINKSGPLNSVLATPTGKEAKILAERKMGSDVCGKRLGRTGVIGQEGKGGARHLVSIFLEGSIEYKEE